jgi:TetR/AcrR family transcriptional regulator, transcriptional repressor for nem operon
MSANAREAILAAAKLVAQAHGYSGLNFRDLAQEVGIKSREYLLSLPKQSRFGCGGGEALLGGFCTLS